MSKKKNEATLFDLALRESMKPANKRSKLVPSTIRPSLLAAHKFVLDWEMSAFLADLTNAPFLKDPERKLQIADSARALARLPHATCWVEYDCRARKVRSKEKYSDTQYPSSGLVEPEEIIPRVGWLFEQHPSLETAFKMTEFADLKGEAGMLPYTYTWVSDEETVLPWRSFRQWSNIGNTPSEVATGIIGWKTDKVGITASAPMMEEQYTGKNIVDLMKETVGELRCAWMFLATINDLPTSFAEVRPSKGFISRGRYHKFSEHKVITLHVPARRSTKVLAAQAIAIIRRRAHEVRGHWRKDYRHPGNRLWIRPHQRGDASLGFVRHDYAVEKDRD